MVIFVLLVAGAAASAALWRATRQVFGAPLFARDNYRGVPVPVGAGVLIGLAVVVVEAVVQSVDAARATSDAGVGWFGTVPSVTALYATGGASAGTLLVLAVVGFGLLGLFDDVAGVGDEKGFRGHLRAMARGRLTTGGLKLVLGGFLAILLVAPIDVLAAGMIPVDAALVALAANLGNLFDRAPGRTTKVGVLCAVPLLLVAEAGVAEPLAAVVGAAVGLLGFELRERLMLGDAGANALGAALGVAVVLTAAPATRTVVAVLLLALNLASEKVSFSDVIARVAPLRWVDRLGRLPRPPS